MEKSNWTGRAVVVGRAGLTAALRREELARPGVYVLLGPPEPTGRRLYIGEADVLRDRLKQHAVGKEFWTELIAFTSSDDNLNKAHVRYLESQLVRLAKKTNQWRIENANEPAVPALSERERAHAEWFLGEMLVIYPVLGVDAFEDASMEPPTLQGDEFRLAERGVEAKGREANNGFVVLEGARGRLVVTASAKGAIMALRQDLKERGVLAEREGALTLTQDFRFDSPSSASGVLIGGSSNGREAWKTLDGRTLKAVQEARERVA